MVGEGLPDLAMVLLPGSLGNTQGLQRDSVRIDHSKYIVVGDDEQLGRSAKGGVFIGKEARVHMTVRADDGQIGYCIVQLARDPPLRGIGTKVPIRGEVPFWVCQGFGPPANVAGAIWRR